MIRRLVFIFFLTGLLPALEAAEIWVAPDGNDQNPGTREQPLASVSFAQRQARELRRRNDPSVAGGIRILLRNGTYPLLAPLLIRPEDSGTESSPTIFAAAPGENPVLSGGRALTGWQLLTESPPGLATAARGQVWFCEPPLAGDRPLAFRQLWVNDRKATRARTPGDPELARMVSWDRTRREAWIPAASVAALGAQLTRGLEMVIYQMWEIAIVRVKSLEVQGDKARLTFQEPESQIEFEHPWPQPAFNATGNAPFFLVNALAFLDTPGEWFQDPATGRVYYWPREGENLASARVIAPALETVVTIGGSLDLPVQHVEFQGLTFAHTAWNRPGSAGHVPLQAGMFMTDAYKLTPKGTPDWHGLDNQAWTGRPPGAVSINAARALRFQRCRFEHLGASGLDLRSGVHDSAVEGCRFSDIGINGLQLGYFSEDGFEAHRPYDPTDQREVTARVRVANNLVTDCANEDWGGLGIGVGFAREITIEHNEVNNVSYTGISVGWGWTRTVNALRRNVIRANHIHHYATRMSDTGGIYLLSAQPGTLVAENHVHSVSISRYAHDPEHWFYLYLDEGSSFITVRDNWCPEERFLKNANGPGNTWERNGPSVPDTIKAAAGLEPAFRDLLESKVSSAR